MLVLLWLLSLLSLLSPNLSRVTMSHAGTAIAGNLGLCRLQCLWRCIKPHPVAMFFVRPSQQFENSLRIVNSCAEAPKTWTWTSWCLPAMLWDAMGCYGLGWARSAAGYFRSHGSDATQIGWQLLTAGQAHRCHWDALAQKDSWKMRDPETASVVLESWTVCEPINNKNQ